MEPYIIYAPKVLDACVQLPSSKSISNRALVLHALSQGCNANRPTNLSSCDDTQVMIKAWEGNGEVIDIKAAGTAMRFLTAYLSVTPGTHVITGTERMKQRPIRILVDALRLLGAEIAYECQEGYPPLRITGKSLASRELTLAGNVSSQYISALLMIGPVLPDGLKLTLQGEIISRPYINLTLQLMKQFGAKAGWTSPCTIEVESKPYEDVPFAVEGDWSAASYWYEMLALSRDAQAKVFLKGLQAESSQGDSRGAVLFEKLGVKTSFVEGGAWISKCGEPVREIVEDLVDIPDLAQTFVVTCCMMGIPFRFTGLQSLKIKETDRIVALQQELQKLGFVVSSENDSILYWQGERCAIEDDAVIQTYEDHRMAMAFAPACLRLPSIKIAHPEVVTKSYPEFWSHLVEAKFEIKK